MCAEVKLVGLNPLAGKLRSLTGLLNGRPLTLPFYQNAEMRRWVEQQLANESPEAIVVFSSAMAQYLDTDAARRLPRVIDFVDVDSDKWRQYAEAKPFYSAWLFRREARRLQAFDIEVARDCDVSLFVSPDEAALFRRMVDDERVRVDHMTNGVDTDFFSPCNDFDNPYPAGENALVFTGAMDYWANVDAVSWFCEQVMPLLRQTPEKPRFYIVGSRPDEAVKRLACEDVIVTGRVEDVRPYLAHAGAVVAPMRIARGIQNKVLEGMSMARPVVTSSKGFEGINAHPGVDLLVADEPRDYADKVPAVLRGEYPELPAKAREQVCRAHGWDASLERLQGFLPETSS